MDSLVQGYPSHRPEEGQWPGPTIIYCAPIAVKARATPGDAPGLARVTPDQEGPLDDPRGHHVATLAPPRTPSGAPREREGRPSCPGLPRDEKTHRSMSTATPGLPEITPGRL